MKSSERWLIPGELRGVDPAAAGRLRAEVSRAAAGIGLDKVTAAVVLIELAVELMASNRPPYDPGTAREVLERAVVRHFAERIE